MRFKWIRNSIVIIVFSMIALLGLAHRDAVVAGQQNSDKIEGLLLDQFTTESSADFLIQFSEQAELSPAYSMDWDTRGDFVYSSLKETAERSQENAKQTLDASGIKYQSFFTGNEIYVWGGDITLASDLSTLPEVSFIRAPRINYIDPIEIKNPFKSITWAGDLLATHALTTAGISPDATIDWGITDTKANQFWTIFGVQGSGIVVANIDTGVQWDHPALDQSFKCNSDPTNPACWFDPADICGGSPCDNHGHGTHTMGTMVGDDDPSLTYIVGMAPNAKWIACKGCEDNSCSEFSLNACADWILAPNGYPANRPNIVNNSWGGGTSDDWYLTKVNSWRAAGIFPAFSAGNTGDDGCTTIGSPGDYQASFASAAHDLSRTIASFSSRGPSVFGHDPYTKPNLSAPGVSICSAIKDSKWSCGYSGTSMASPHTAGAVALLWSCNPSLVGQIDTTFKLLQNYSDCAPAGSCGAPPDGQGNYTYGYGYLNVLSAGNAACGGWQKTALPPGCPDWTRYDGEYYAGTGKVYFLGGRVNDTVTDGTIYSYDPVTNTCSSTGKIMPNPVSNYSIASINNGAADLLCTFGGRNSAGAQTLNVQCYNPNTNTVSPIANLPAAWAGNVPGAVVVLNNKVYLFGGFNPSGPTYVTARTDVFDPVANSFSQKGNLNLARTYIMAAAVNGKIYAFGGDTYTTGLVAQTIAEVFDPMTGNWDDLSVADLITASGEGRAFGFDSNSGYSLAGKIVLVGGGIWSDDSNAVLTYDTMSNTYDSSFPDLNIERRDFASFFLPTNQGMMVVFGGFNNSVCYGGESPPHAPLEYFRLLGNNYLPIIGK
jgi:hypothetical protein